MKNTLNRFFLFASVAGLALTFSACGDDSSSSATSSEDDDVVLSSSVESSSSDEDDVTSSSDEDKSVSSSSKDKAKSSDSEDESSSSAEAKSSSSEGKSSSGEAESSSSSENTTGSKYDAEKNTLTDFRNGNVYRTVVMGEGDKAQVWMAENLDFVYKVKDSEYGIFCNGDKPENCETFGRLYTWAAAMDSAAVFSDDGKGCNEEGCKAKGNVRGVCPEGWHLPSAGEMNDLYAFALEASDDDLRKAAFSLMSKDNWFYEDYVSTDGTDDFGFSLIGSGYFSKGNYLIGYVANLWTSTLNEDGIVILNAYQDGSLNVTEMSSGEEYADPESEGQEKETFATAYSVRCLKN